MAAAAGEDSAAGAAMEQLCRDAWRPLYVFARRWGCTREDVEDAVQGFIASVLARQSLGTIEAGRGRFRSFLLAGMRNHLSDLHSKATATKRGGGALQTVVIYPDSQSLAALTSGGFARYRIPDGQLLQRYSYPDAHTLSFEPDGSAIVAAGKAIARFSPGSGPAPAPEQIHPAVTISLPGLTTLATLQAPGDRPVYQLAISLDSRWLAVATTQGRIQLWDMQAMTAHLQSLGLNW